MFVLIGLFKNIKQWEQFLKILYIRKKSITCDYIPNSVQPHWLVLTIYSIKLLKLNGKCLLFKIIIYLNINTWKNKENNGNKANKFIKIRYSFKCYL